jgi:hypothetical protein
MSIIDQENSKQAAYEAAKAAAEALAHHPPAYQEPVIVVRSDLQGNPAPVTVGAVGYDAVAKKILLQTLNADGAPSGSISLEVDCAEPFREALRRITI